MKLALDPLTHRHERLDAQFAGRVWVGEIVGAKQPGRPAVAVGPLPLDSFALPDEPSKHTSHPSRGDMHSLFVDSELAS